MRKSITREAFWDILQESKSQNGQKDEMAWTSLPPKLPQSNSTNDQNPTSSISKLPAAKGKQSKSKNDQTAMARSKLPGKGQPKAKDDQNVPSRKANLLATGQHSKFLEDLDWIFFPSGKGGGKQGTGEGTPSWWFEVFLLGAWISQFWNGLYKVYVTYLIMYMDKDSQNFGVVCVIL